MLPKWSIWIVLGTSFSIIFLYNSQFPENSYFATIIMRNACFYFTRLSVWRSKIYQQTMFLKRHLFFKIYADFIELLDSGIPSKSSVRQNVTPNRPSFARLLSREPGNLRCTGIFSRPVSPRLFGLTCTFCTTLGSVFDQFQIPFYLISLGLGHHSSYSLCAGRHVFSVARKFQAPGL